MTMSKLKSITSVLAILLLLSPLAATPHEMGPVGPDGREIVCDLPQAEKKHNVGGRDGAGLCVFTSIEYAGRWQHVLPLFDFQKDMTQEDGGGWPDKVDDMLKKYAPSVAYIQDTTGDPKILELALKTGRMPCVTYDGHDCHYSGTIGHMICLVYLDDQYAAVTDNNFPEDEQVTWMTRDEFLARWRGNGGGWTVILLSPPPPPLPHNHK